MFLMMWSIEGGINLTRCRAVRVVPSQLTLVKSPSSPVRSTTHFARFEEARICFTEGRSSSSSFSESKISPSSES
jgi:hypothetical protein